MNHFVLCHAPCNVKNVTEHQQERGPARAWGFETERYLCISVFSQKHFQLQ